MTAATLTHPNAGPGSGFLRYLMLLVAMLMTACGAEAQSNPVITSFSPTSGPAGTVVTVYGSDLRAVRLAQLQGSQDTPVRNVTDRSLQFTISNVAQTGRVRLISNCCAGLSADTFTVTGDPIVRPTISSFTPASGPVGTVITVTGTNLQQVRLAMLGGSADAVPYNVSSNSLQFSVPTGASTGRIRVMNTVYDAYSSNSFTITSGTAPSPMPFVSGFSPTSGPVGTVVTVTGTGFTGATSAQIGVSSVVAVGNVTSTSLTFTVPSGATSGMIRISNGANSDTSDSGFTVTVPAAVPTITGFSPASGPVGTVITVSGTGFTGVTTAQVGASAAVAVGNVTSTSLTFTVPSGASSGAIRISNGTTSDLSDSNFTVTTPAATPAITGFSPTSGPVGTVITVTGSGFTGATSASIGGGAAVAVSNVGSTSLTFTVPAGATSGTIRIANATNVGTSSGSFTVTIPAATPVISSFSPASGPVGTVVTVSGTGFTGATSAQINGGATIAVSNVTSTSLTFTVPTGATSGMIRVANATNSDTSDGSFTVTVPAATPAVTSFSPTSGAVGTVVTVTGTGFTGATSASIGGGSAVAVGNVTSTSLTFTVPTGATSGTIRVANATNSGTSTGSFTVTVPPVVPPGGALGETAASRLLTQGTFGPTLNTINSAASQTYDQWFTAQLAATPSLISPSVPNDNAAWLPVWWNNVINGQDQLRQRMAFALSEIFVISDEAEVLINRDQPLAVYYDILTNNSLGNFRTLLEQVTLSPAMGRYLTHFRNDKADPSVGRHADQNYAREVMQLFTIGLVELNIDGSVKRDSSGNPIPTYAPRHVEALANTFTGWASAPTLYTGETAWMHDDNYVRQMVAYENHHDTSQKTIVGNVVIPAGGTAASDLRVALDTLANHPNVGPFIALRLIQRMVTSNPSPQYIARVARVFNNNGSGTRGDLFAVARAILTDPEAVATGDNTYGKVREPLIRLTNVWRAFTASAASGSYTQFKFLEEPRRAFAQSALSAPSVFNFFAPDFQRVGNISFAGLVSPEFQNTNENTLILTSNLLQDAIYQYQDSSGRRFADADPQRTTGFGSDDVFIRTAAWEGFAANPATLVDRLNLVFMQNQMPTAMRTTLINYVTAIPASTPASRVIEALDLLVNSPQYAVQR